MQQTPEIESFIARVETLPTGPGVSLDAMLQPSLDDEAELRKLFATDRQNARLVNSHVGLVDIFSASGAIRTTRARVIEAKDDLNACHVMPLSEENRRKEGAPCMVADIDEFKQNWGIFTEGALSQLIDWNNVVAAGGSVLACLSPLDEEDKASKRAIRKFYHSNAYPTSDVDLFLWGMNPEQAEAKIKVIYEAVRDSVPWDVTCIRTKHTVSMHSQYPYRSVQIVLRLYQSPAEILAGFDIDAPCCAYDGQRVWANPRAIVAMMRQCNTVDMTRRSPSYEIRLAKYAQRAFEVYVPGLKRDEIDPTIFERSIARMEGLARLLVLEILATDNIRTAFLANRRYLRGRPIMTGSYKRHARKYKDDLKGEIGFGIEMNDYDVASLHIPYGPGWDARKIDKLVYQTDLGMNSTFNPKNKGRRLHRHPAFFGTIVECLEDCCENCPKPIDDDEKKLKQEEDELYVCGRIKFVEENPGRQSITGSFNPIDVGEWSEQVYIEPTQLLFTAIAANHRAAVDKLLQDGIDVNQRDYVGRTTLHVAIFAKTGDIACDLIDAGARITARMVDGRTPLHLAAQYDQPLIIKKLLEKNSKNVMDAEKNVGEGKDKDEDKMGTTNPQGRLSSEDDWSSHDDEMDEDEDEVEDDDNDNDKPVKKIKVPATSQEQPAESGEILEESEDQPDIIDIDAFDWDFGFSALAYAVLYASIPTLDALVGAGANPKLPSKHGFMSPPLHPLTLTILRQDEDEACNIAERLLQLPSVTSSTANPQLRTIFHFAAWAGRTKLVETLLRYDLHARTVINFPSAQYQSVIFPVVSAINQGNLGVLGVLLAHGVKLHLEEEDVANSLSAGGPEAMKKVAGYAPIKNYLNLSCQPLEAAMRAGDDISKLLTSLGATVDFGLKQAFSTYSNPNNRRTLKDWVDFSVNSVILEIGRLTLALQTAEANIKTSKLNQHATTIGWKAFYQQYTESLHQNATPRDQYLERRGIQRQKDALESLADIKDFLLDMQSFLDSRNAKTWTDVYPSVPTEASLPVIDHIAFKPKLATGPNLEEKNAYVYLTTSNHRQNVPQHLTDRYDELFEACYAGNHEKIQGLCLPVEGQQATSGLDIPTPLNISVKLLDPDNSQYSTSGYTPFFAAITARRWSTAKLILAIATAQYEPADATDKIKFSIDLDSDDEADDSDAESDASEATVERQEIKFIDIATRPSATKSEVHPRMLFQESVRWAKPSSSPDFGPKSGVATPLQKTIIDHDLEAFVHIANLYQTLPQAEPLDPSLLAHIIQYDESDILDEYIRRTGAGIDITGARKTTGMKEGEGEIPTATNDSNKMYLGLNIEGKKRMDLARKNDPNAQDLNDKWDPPFVWQAVEGKAKAVVQYLSTDRPLAAYNFYAITHSDPKAIWFRRMRGKGFGSEDKLEKQLPAWLGWTINPLGESPFTAAVLSDDVDVIKLVAKLQPNLTVQALQTRIKFVGVNPVTLAVCRQCNTKVFDYLLSRKVSATERGVNDGWNIYHHICECNNVDMLEYFLKKLPKDVNEVLLGQQAKGSLNTPLHIAVKKGAMRLVAALLAYSHSTLLVRDVDGQIPLFCAVKLTRVNITKQLLAVSPLEAIYTENSVGNTALDTAAANDLKYRLRGTNQQSYFQLGELNPSSYVLSNNPSKVFIESEEKITEMLEAVRHSHGINKDLVLAAASKWAVAREPKLRAFKEREELRKQQREEEEEEERNTRENDALNHPLLAIIDVMDAGKVWTLVRDAVKAHPTVPGRKLIHLFEVQQSVTASLANVHGELIAEECEGDTYNRRAYRIRRGRAKQILAEFCDEEDVDKKARRESMVFKYLHTGSDTL